VQGGELLCQLPAASSSVGNALLAPCAALAADFAAVCSVLQYVETPPEKIVQYITTSI
jgi:hypothetical protein